MTEEDSVCVGGGTQKVPSIPELLAASPHPSEDPCLISMLRGCGGFKGIEILRPGVSSLGLAPVLHCPPEPSQAIKMHNGIFRP
jgi:hypothetical protein